MSLCLCVMLRQSHNPRSLLPLMSASFGGVVGDGCWACRPADLVGFELTSSDLAAIVDRIEQVIVPSANACDITTNMGSTARYVAAERSGPAQILPMAVAASMIPATARLITRSWRLRSRSQLCSRSMIASVFAGVPR